jgi:hypothetical protein
LKRKKFKIAINYCILGRIRDPRIYPEEILFKRQKKKKLLNKLLKVESHVTFIYLFTRVSAHKQDTFLMND